MTTQNPVFYDSVQDVHRPMDAGATVPPTAVPISATQGNKLQVLSDGLYLGTEAGLVLYLDSVNGVDTNSGAKASPLKTLAGAFTYLNNLFPGASYQGQSITLALKSGQSFPQTSDFNLAIGAQLGVSFYNDPKYGDFNSPQVAGTTNPWNMADLTRPIIQPQITQSATLNKIFGFNLQGGELDLSGVSIQLPGPATNPAISDMSAFADYIRSTTTTRDSTLSMAGVVFNMTSTVAYWGAIGCQSRSKLTINQFATQFQVLGQPLVSGTSWPTSTLNARQYFIKFYDDFAGNNQNALYMSPTSATASNGSGIIFCSWSDTEALTVTGSSTSQATFPLSFDVGYGLVQYIYGLNKNASGTLLNFINSRLM